MMRKTLVLALVLLAGAGCFARRAKRYFELNVSAPGSAGPVFDRTILLERPEVDELYDDFRIIYRISPTEINYYAYTFWAGRPADLVRNVIRNRFLLPGCFKRVDVDLGPESADWTLRAKLFRIEEIDEDAQWSGRLAMRLAVIETATGKTVAVHDFDRIEPLARKDPGLLAGVVSRILQEELEIFLRKLAV